MKPKADPRITALVIAVSKYYRETLDDEVVALYVADLADIGTFEEISVAYDSYRRDPRNFRNPLPAQIRIIAQPNATERQEALDLARQMIATISRRGHVWNQTFKHDGHASLRDAVVAELGEVAWEVVERQGTWKSLCEESAQGNLGTFTAQLRDHIEAVLQLAKSGKLRKRLALPTSSPSQTRLLPLSEALPAIAKALPQEPNPNRSYGQLEGSQKTAVQNHPIRRGTA